MEIFKSYVPPSPRGHNVRSEYGFFVLMFTNVTYGLCFRFDSGGSFWFSHSPMLYMTSIATGARANLRWHQHPSHNPKWWIDGLSIDMLSWVVLMVWKVNFQRMAAGICRTSAEFAEIFSKSQYISVVQQILWNSGESGKNTVGEILKNWMRFKQIVQTFQGSWGDVAKKIRKRVFFSCI